MPAPSKSRRQATACEWCRAHKLKCDAEQPSCKNCARRVVPCVTVNLRKPGAEGQRKPPVGRRRSSRKRTPRSNRPSTVSRTTSRCSASQTPYPSVASSEGVYPPSPLQPIGRDFEPRSPDRILPAIFAAPFDHDDDTGPPHSRLPADLRRGPGRSDSRSPHDQHDRQDLSDSSGAVVAADTHIEAAPTRSEGQVAGGNTNSHHVLVQWLDLFFMQNAAWEPVFPYFRRGQAYAAEVPLPSPLPLLVGASPAPALPLLPDIATVSKYTTLFFTKIHPVFPVVDRLAFKLALAALRRKMDDPLRIEPLDASDYPLIACAYAMFSLAADEDAGGPSSEGTRYLEAVYLLYAHLVALPYIASIQALLLLTLVLRNRNKDAASWGSLGQAIRIAQVIGLHRRADDSGRGKEEGGDGDVHARIWWAAYILERTMELETGRPSAIRDEECDQRVPRPDASDASFNYFQALIGLAKIKTRAIRLLYNNGSNDKHQKRQRPVKELLFEMGYIDRALLDWADTFPESIRPGRDIFCGGDELHLATYVALQYHQTVIALHRPALMSAPGFLRNRINEYCAGTPLHDRLHFSLCIGAASARAILKETNDLAMYAGLSRIITADQILLAVLVLGIYVAKVPMSRLNRSDLALVDAFGEQVEEEYLRAGHSPEFVKGIHLFRSQLCDYIAGLQVNARSRAAAAAQTNPPPPSSSCNTEQEAPSSMDLLLEGGFDLTADVTNLEASWAHFWNEDFEKLLAVQPEPDTTSMENATNMYLLGIPQSWP